MLVVSLSGGSVVRMFDRGELLGALVKERIHHLVRRLARLSLGASNAARLTDLLLVLVVELFETSGSEVTGY